MKKATNLKILPLFVLILLFCGSMGFATETISLSLEEAQKYAVEHSAKTTNARTDVSIAKKKIWETTAIGLPQINGSVSYQDMTQIPITLVPARIFDESAAEDDFIEMQFGTQHNASLDITATQLVFQGSYIVALQASKVYLKLSQNSLIKSEIEVKETVAQTYYLILSAQDIRKTLVSTLDNLKKNLYEFSEMHKAGFMEDTDVDQLQLAVTDLDNSLRSLDRQIFISFRLLKFQMGMDLGSEIHLKDNLDMILKQIDTEFLLSTPFKVFDHIDYRIVDNQERSMALLLKKEKFDYLPSVHAFVTHQENSMRNEFSFFKDTDDKWFPSTIIGINVNVPIFSSGMRAARVQQAKMELNKVQRAKKDLISGLKLGYMQARSEFFDAIEKKKNTRKSLQLARKIYHKTLEKLKQGLATSLELTQTHNQYLSAESNHINAIIGLLSAKIKMDKSLNRL